MASTIGKKTTRLIEATVEQILYRLGHKHSEFMPFRQRSFYRGSSISSGYDPGVIVEWGRYFFCPQCVVMKDQYHIASALDFQLVKTVSDEYFHLYASQRVTSNMNPLKAELALIDMNGNDAMVKRDIPKTYWCIKYQNMT